MKKRLVIIFLSVCCAVGVICMVARNVMEQEKVTINNRYIYSEQSIPGFQTDKQYVRNIMDYLDIYYVENQGFFLSIANDYSVFNKSNVVDIASTYYGCTMAYELGMDIDVVQCRKEIENNYLTELEQCFEQTDAESESGFTHDTYYYVMFKQSFEPEKIDEEVSKKITEKLDDVIEHILAGDTADVVTLRYALEVKANLDSYIYQDALEKISDLLNELYQTKGEYNSRFIDAIKIDMILRLNIFDKQFANKLKQALYRDGGFACKEGETADLKTTYQFYSLISTSELFTITDDEVAQMKQFLSTVDAAGIYNYSTEDTYVDFRSIYYGNTLSSFTLGGKSEK